MRSDRHDGPGALREGPIGGMGFVTRLICLTVATGVAAHLARGADEHSPLYDEEESLLAIYGDEEIISIATGATQPIALAPAVASAVTADEIKEMGARDLDEVLETVPGLHVARNFIGYNPIYTIRGIYSQFNPQVLVLINGIPITNVYQGDRNQVWGGMPVEGIQRIEVIRGPGSAVYGADAFAGVIDIITKTAKDIPRPQVGGRIGSFDTSEAWGLFSRAVRGWDVGLVLEYRDTNGQNERIDRDRQSGLDEAFGTNASLARGPVNLARRLFDARLDAQRDNWHLRVGLQRRRNAEVGAGVSQALDPHGRYNSDRLLADVTYRNADWVRNWDVSLQASYFDTSQVVEQDLRLLPPGTSPDGRAAFPDGVIGNPEVWERHYRLNGWAFFTGLDRHTVRIGAGYQLNDIYRTEEEKNFGLDPNACDPAPPNCAPIPPGSPPVDVTDTDLEFLRERDRENVFAFVQDVWRFANDWTLTAGLRADHYSDFGTTTNPRLALVWATTHNLTTKLLYGEAFRAPSFAELYIRNNPVVEGNPNLNPETIRTVELAFDWRPRHGVQLGMDFFYYKWQDIIRFLPPPTALSGEGEVAIATNAGTQNGYGLELEGAWRVGRDLRLRANYAFQAAEDRRTHMDAGNAPKHQIYLRGDWSMSPQWHLNAQANLVLDRDRAPGDSRSSPDDYAIVDVTLRRALHPLGVEAAVAVRNLLNADAFEPSPGGQQGALIPGDLPLAGRSFFAELRYRF